MCNGYTWFPFDGLSPGMYEAGSRARRAGRTITFRSRTTSGVRLHDTDEPMTQPTFEQLRSPAA